MGHLWVSFISRGSKKYFITLAPATDIMGASVRRIACLCMDDSLCREIEYEKRSSIPGSWGFLEELQGVEEVTTC